MPLPWSIEKYRYLHTKKLSPIMPEKEIDMLTQDIQIFNAKVFDFYMNHHDHDWENNTHTLVEDAFYILALKDLIHDIPPVRRALQQLFYHSHVAKYTIKIGKCIDLYYTLADEDWATYVSDKLRDHESCKFYPARVEDTGSEWSIGNRYGSYASYRRWREFEARQLASDALSLNAKLPATPDRYNIQPWIEQHFKKMLESGLKGSGGHYMSMKLAGARFSFEISQPSDEYWEKLPTDKSRRKKEKEELRQLWQKLRA